MMSGADNAIYLLPDGADPEAAENYIALSRISSGVYSKADMENGEYYGVNKDLGWGPYCIMGGWVMGFFPLLLLADGGAPSIYGIGG